MGWAVGLCAMVLAAGCDDDGGEPVDSFTGALWVEAFVTTLPDDARGERVFLVLASPAGEVIASDDTRLAPLVVLSANTSQAPFDAIVHVPDDPAWTPSQPFGEGTYAIARGLDATPSQLTISRWTRGSAPGAIEGGGAVEAGEEPERVSVTGTVTGPDGAPLSGAFVQVVGQGWTYSDASGNFTIDDLLPGTAEIVIEGPGYRATAEVEVGPGGGEVSHQITAIDPSPAPIVHQGTVLDAETGEPVEGVAVRLDRETVATTDAAGEYSFMHPVGSLGVMFTKDHYSFHWATFLCASETCLANVSIPPLERAFYGEWSYCHSADRPGGDPYVYDIPGVGDVIQLDHTFEPSGLSNRHGIAESRWHAMASHSTDFFLVGTPTPHHGGTQYIISYIFGGYRLEGEDYLVNYSLISRTDHYFKRSGSGAPCLFEGDGTPPGPGGAPTCESAGYDELDETGLSNVFPGDAALELIDVLDGSYEVYCHEVLAGTDVACSSSSSCGGGTCRRTECGEPSCGSFCVEDACGTGAFGIDACPTEREISDGVASGPPETLTVEGRTLSLGELSLTLDMGGSFPDSPYPATPGRAVCSDGDDGYRLSAGEGLSFGDSTAKLGVRIGTYYVTVRADGEKDVRLVFSIDAPPWLDATPGGVVSLRCRTSP